MKYYEFVSPFYALIKAQNERKARAIYKKQVWEGGGDQWRERSRDYAIMKFAMAHDSRNTEVRLMLTEFMDDENDVLLSD
ncbi:hypothetical protein HUG15_07470 [Salicibibacter cibarius]|uniref:Uncharacterized protein n=2 Tax=Bacillaceae TaxID=186817 RepID=A0A1G8Q2F4_9BACI|nr:MULTISPECIES: hypothetical protein [Bacillaceae]QQK75435.1 hypothetical protein HUG15_07470 [Salicibibacter cibarius]SDI98270.1 hypothetical protein SAMN04488123_11046 [Natribacillus halophilus]